MKLILDEWIVREVIDTLYMARTTFLGITGLDSPQDVEKKSANETAITRRISKAIDIIQQSEQQPMPESLEKAAEEYAQLDEEGMWKDGGKYKGFIAGAKWQAEQNNRDVVFWKGMQHAIEGMKKDAVEGEVTERTVSGSRPETFAITTKHFESSTLKMGDKVKVIIIKDDGKSD